MMRGIKILFGTIALLYVIGTTYQMFLFLDYHSNIDEITEEFCINKDKPEMQCNGSCHLKKQLQKSPMAPLQIDKTSEESPEFSLVSFDTFNELTYVQLLKMNNDQDILVLPPVNLYTNTWISDILDPPEYV